MDRLPLRYFTSILHIFRMLYLTPQDWAEVESNLIGSNSHEVIKLYNGIFDIMNFIWNKTRFQNQVVLSTAMVYFHKYFLNIKKFDNDLEKWVTCTTCLFIATKTSNYLIQLDTLVKILIECINKFPWGVESFLGLREEILKVEFEIMNSLGFDLDVDLPYKYLGQIKKFFEAFLKLNTKKLSELCCFYMNDSFTLPLCLYYPPMTIAISCILLLFQQFKIDMSKETVISELDKEGMVDVKEIWECAKLSNLMYSWGVNTSPKDNACSERSNTSPQDRLCSHISNMGGVVCKD